MMFHLMLSQRPWQGQWQLRGQGFVENPQGDLRLEG